MKKIILFQFFCLSIGFLKAQWTTSGTNIYNSNSGNVGIGTSTPNEKLEVTGNVKSTGWIAAGGTPVSGYGGTSGYGILLPSTTNDYIRIIGEHDGGDASNGVFLTGDNLDDGWIFRQSDCCGAGTLDYAKIARNQFYYIGGSMGIGTSNPQQKLVVSNSGAEGFEVYLGQPTGVIGLQSYNRVLGQYSKMQFDASQFAFMDGNVGIGTTTPQSKLAVNGDIFSKKVKVTQTGWPDYVFHNNYPLPSLAEIEKYIQQHKHLPEVPSAEEVEKNGLDLGNNQAVLLKKIEELTLYIIEQDKTIKEQNIQIQSLQNQGKELLEMKKELDVIKSKLQNIN